MLIARGWICYIFLITIVILILICPLAVQKTEGTSSNGEEAPIYKVSISENTQRDIWRLCEKYALSYELVLAIYQIEGDNNTRIDNIEAKIGKLAYYRNYWDEQGYSDEIVFDLMLLSEQRGIEGCKIFMKDSDYYDLDNFVQSVTEYKYYLEQN